MSGFDDLERQLRARVTGQVARRRRRTLRAGTLALCAFVSVGTVTAAATGVIGRTVLSGADRVTPLEKLLTDVTNTVQRTPGCASPRGGSRAAKLSALPAAPATIRAFPQLGRPPTARERALGRRYGRQLGAAQVLSGGARELRTVGGTRFLLIIQPGADATTGLFAAECLARQRAELERRAPAYDDAVVAAARASLDRSERTSRQALGRERLLLVEFTPSGRLGTGLGTFSDVAIHRGSVSFGRAVSGLVPAPAAYVVVRPRTGPGKRIRIAVPQRVFRLVLPKGYPRRISIEWRARDGKLLHVVKLLR